MDPTALDLLVGGALALLPAVLAFLAGTATGRAVERRTSTRSPALRCSCGHGYGAHEAGRQCNTQIKRPAQWDRYGSAQGFEWVRCPCSEYDGPEPLPRAWIPPPLP